MYRKGNKNKTITSLVLVLVLTLSIGFAAFSNTLRITPQATITPDSATFDIDFSSSNTGVVTGNITPSLTGSGLTAEAAIIDNSTNPTISNLSVNFTKPGQKAEYKFYAYNNGEYLAYLNSVNFLNAEGKDAFKTCEAVESTTQYVDGACVGIKVSVKVGNLTTDKTESNITNHSLARQTAEEIIVTIEYEENSAVADGTFNVTFGDITLVYTSVDGETQENIVYDANVATAAELKVALANGGRIALTEDITITERMTVTKDVVIDLNGNKFDASVMNGTANAKDRPFWLESGSSLTINAQNSEIALGAHGLVNIQNAENVNVTLNGGSYTGPTQNGALIRLKAGADKVNIDLNNVEYNDTASDGYIVSTTGFDGSGTMTVNGGSYAANYGFQIYGLEATLKDVEINTQGTAIEASSSSNVTVENCDITINNVTVGTANPSGIAASHGGTITVNNSNFQGTMEAVYYVYWDTETNSGGNIYATNNNIEEANYTYRSFKRSWAEGEIVIDGVKIPDNY